MPRSATVQFLAALFALALASAPVDYASPGKAGFDGKAALAAPGGGNAGGNSGGGNAGGNSGGGNAGGNSGGSSAGGNSGGSNAGGSNAGGNSGGSNAGGNSGGSNAGGNSSGENGGSGAGEPGGPQASGGLGQPGAAPEAAPAPGAFDVAAPANANSPVAKLRDYRTAVLENNLEAAAAALADVATGELTEGDIERIHEVLGIDGDDTELSAGSIAEQVQALEEAAVP